MKEFNADEWQAYGKWLVLKPFPMVSATKSGIVLPKAMNLENKALRRCEVISVGREIDDIVAGNIVWAMVLMGQWTGKDDGSSYVFMYGQNNIMAIENQ